MPDEVDLLERDIFENAVSDEIVGAEALEQDTPVTEEDEGQDRDELGRFKSEEPAQEQAKQTEEVRDQPEERGHIPAWRLKEEAEAKREAIARYEAAERERQNYAMQLQQMQQRIAQLEPKPKPEDEPDPLLDPKGYAKTIEDKFNERLVNQQREFDLRLAHQRHGKTFEEAYSWAQQRLQSGDNTLRVLMNNTNSPGEALVNAYQSDKTMREVGSDPNAWLEKKLEERLNDPTFLSKAIERAQSQANGAQPGTRPNTGFSLPPSLSRATNSPVRDDGPEDDSDAALLSYAMRR